MDCTLVVGPDVFGDIKIMNTQQQHTPVCSEHAVLIKYIIGDEVESEKVSFQSVVLTERQGQTQRSFHNLKAR